MTTAALVYPFASVTQIPDIEGLSIREPVDGPRPTVTQGFGVVSVTGILHKGIDYSIITGTPLLAVDAGVVEFTYNDGKPHYGALPAGYTDGSPGGYGNQCIVRHRWGFSMQAHMDMVVVSPGQWVKRGAQLGVSDSTGISTGPHLHWELRLPDNSTRFDPTKYINAAVPPPPDTDEEWFMSLSDAQKSALEEVAEAQINGQVFYAGSPGRTLLIKAMNTFADLPLDPGEEEPLPGKIRRAQTRALGGFASAVRRWGKAPKA